jgi:tetratricopeptide (TPR) repeat protein
MFAIRRLSGIAVLAYCVGISQFAWADQHDAKLEKLFKLLHDAPNAGTAASVEASIWQLWLQHDDPKCQQLMQQGIAELNHGSLNAALTTYSQLIKIAPDYAEAWNKRATVYYLLENFAASELDIQQTLKLEPFHFGALSGRGLVKLAQRDYLGARTAFNATLEVYPQSEAAKYSLEELDTFLQNKSI